MLNNISKLLTGDMLKVLCDMGHGDVLILADANFPGESIAKKTTFGKLIRCPGADVNTLLKAIVDIFPLDVDYTEYPACVMELTDSDKAKSMPTPIAWCDYTETLHKSYPTLTLGKIERFDFYERAKKAYAVIQTGEEKQYGNLLLVKGCVL
jgi:L-fucose mutarotase